jgi:hypothetical protein
MVKKFDVDEWAASARPVNACKTCALPKAAEVIRVVMQARADGRSRASVRQLLEMLQEQFGYTIGQNGLTTHIRKCEADLYKKAWPKN